MAHAEQKPVSAARTVSRDVEVAWLALARRAACAAAALAALVALVSHAPVRIAVLRGTIAWLAVLALAACGRVLIASAGRARAAEPREAP